MIKEKSIELRDQAQQTAEEAMGRAKAIAADARARAEELTRQLKRQPQSTVAIETPEGKPTAV